jgi:lactoylglutathione lyase
MEAAVPTKATWEIMGARHGGITVSDLDRSLAFYCDVVGLELVWRREYANDEIRQIVGVPEATAVDIAMLDIPGGGAQVELLEYKGCERKSGSTPPSDYGTGHFCVFVRDIEACHAELASKGVRFRSNGPVEMREGPNTGGKSLYALDPDGYIFEFHERPPHVAP